MRYIVAPFFCCGQCPIDLALQSGAGYAVLFDRDNALEWHLAFRLGLRGYLHKGLGDGVFNV
jgi:hypothetical protein